MQRADVGSATAAALDELVREAKALGIGLDVATRDKFATYVETLLLWRTRLSLTGASTALDIIRYHLVDSLHLCRFVSPGCAFADIGSGAGFPGLPVALATQDASVTLVESRRKRANFLREVVRRTGSTNVQVDERRSEELDDQAFDLVAARALGAVGEFLELSHRLLKAGGTAIIMKGPGGRSEAIGRIEFAEPQVVDYRLSGDRQRTLLVYRKL